MKNGIYLFVMATALLLSGCGKSGGSSNKNAQVYGYNTCQVGYVNTQHGCLPQGNCPPGQGLYGNQCIQGTYGQGQQCQAGYVFSSQYGCLPQGQCPAGHGLYGNQCVYADGFNNGGYHGGNQWGGGWGWGAGGGWGWGGGGGWGWGGGYQRYCYWWYGQLMCQ